MDLLSRETIIEAFERLDAALAKKEVKAELFLVGGAVMCLALESRPATKDVDAWFTEPSAVRAAAQVVADEMSLPVDWLNDAAKAFVPLGAGFERWRSFAHLDVSVADDRTLLAMKCAAARSTEDAGDIRVLVDRLGMTTAEEVLAVVLTYYPPERLAVRTQLLLDEIFDDRG